MRLHRVIYNVIEEIESAMKGLFDQNLKNKLSDKLKFVKHSKFLKLVLLLDVMLLKVNYANAGVRIIRDGIVQYEGELDTLKRSKMMLRKLQRL